MNIIIKATNIELTAPLQEYVESKFNTLAHFIPRFEETGVAEVHVEIGRSTNHHHSGEVFFAEANLRLPGEVLRASEDAVDVRVAIDAVKDKIQREIEKYIGKYKEKTRS